MFFFTLGICSVFNERPLTQLGESQPMEDVLKGFFKMTSESEILKMSSVADEGIMFMLDTHNFAILNSANDGSVSVSLGSQGFYVDQVSQNLF